MPKKIPQIIYKKLGNEWAWGQAWQSIKHPRIEIDPRLGAKRHLEVLCHEALHIALPELQGKKGEAEIDRLGKLVSAVLWKDGYRKVWMQKHHTPVLITKDRPQGRKKKKCVQKKSS